MIALKPAVLAHFGLKRNPFGGLHGAEDYYRSSEYRTALAMVEYAIEHDDVVALIGEIGSGKTDAMAMVRAQLAARPDLHVAFVRPEVADKQKLRIQHVVDAFLHHFQVETPPGSLQRRAWLVRNQLTQADRQGRKLALVLDEAHRLPGPFLKSLKEFHEQMRFGLRASLFAVILIGHKELPGHYRKVARDVWDRLDAGNCALIGNLTPPEGAAYIAHRLESAGAAGLFDKPAMAAAARLASGPLGLNVVCWKVLEAGYVEGHKAVTEASVLLAFDRVGLAERLGLSRAEIAARAGIGRSTVDDVMADKAGTESKRKVDQVLRAALHQSGADKRKGA